MADINRAEIILLSDVVLWGEVGNSRYSGPYAIASALRKAGFRVAIIDYFTRMSREEFFKFIEKCASPSLKYVGISSTFLAPHFDTLDTRKHRSVGLQRFYSGELFLNSADDLREWSARLKEIIRRKSPVAKLVLGGVKAQFARLRPYGYEEFDYIVMGPGDHAAVEIAQAIASGREPEMVPFLDGVIVDNRYDKLNRSCPKHLLVEEDGLAHGEALPLEIARGCVFNCKFCHYEKKESFKKPLEDLREEMLRNFELFGTRTYLFSDDCFNDHPSKVERTCEMFLGLPFPVEWTAYARVDVAVKFPHTVDLMVRSGARGLFWGLESFDAEVARRAGKGTPPDKVKKFLENFKNSYRGQCLSEGSFIVGLPGEGRDSLMRTLEWVLEKDALDLATFGPLGLMPYVDSLDKLVFDYAEYSRHPQKYGFKKVSFNPNYWETEQMNSDEAAEIAAEMVVAWKASKKPGLLRTIWFYPHLKTLGFLSTEIESICRDDEKIEFWAREIANRFKRHTSEYHKRLAATWGE
jgi:radical SAM superfamily enzyme YgiQ (UPF0313 family)